MATTYTEMLVQVSEAHGTPREVRQRIDAAIRREFGLDRLSDLTVTIECHTGSCALELCGRDLHDKNAFPHDG